MAESNMIDVRTADGWITLDATDPANADALAALPGQEELGHWLESVKPPRAPRRRTARSGAAAPVATYAMSAESKSS